MSIARQLLDELRSDEELRKEFVEEIAIELLKNRDIRIAVLRALKRDIATKKDIEDLRNYIDQKIDQKVESLRKEMKDLEQCLRKEFRDEISRVWDRLQSIDSRLSRVEGTLNLLVKVFIAFNLPILIALIGILLKMIFG